MYWFFNRVMTAAGRSPWNDTVDEMWNAEVIKLIACVFLTVRGRHLSLNTHKQLTIVNSNKNPPANATTDGRGEIRTSWPSSEPMKLALFLIDRSRCRPLLRNIHFFFFLLIKKYSPLEILNHKAATGKIYVANLLTKRRQSNIYPRTTKTVARPVLTEEYFSQSTVITHEIFYCMRYVQNKKQKTKNEQMM